MLITNNKFPNYVRFLSTIFFCCNLLLTVSCQVKEKNVETITQECQVFLDKDDLEKTSACFQKAILANPLNAEQISTAGTKAFFKKCVELKDKEDYKNTIVCFEGVSQLSPQSANVYFNLAFVYLKYQKEKKYGDTGLLILAKEAVQKGLEIQPNDASARSLYGEICNDLGEKDKAIAESRKAVEISPETYIYWMRLGLVQESANKNEDAVNSYKKALEINPKDIDAMFFLAKLYEKLGKIDEAVEMIERQNKVEPPNEETVQKLNKLKDMKKKKPQ